MRVTPMRVIRRGVRPAVLRQCIRSFSPPEALDQCFSSVASGEGLKPCFIPLPDAGACDLERKRQRTAGSGSIQPDAFDMRACSSLETAAGRRSRCNTRRWLAAGRRLTPRHRRCPSSNRADYNSRRTSTSLGPRVVERYVRPPSCSSSDARRSRETSSVLTVTMTSPRSTSGP